MSTLFESQITSVPMVHRGKVRDIYDLDNDHLLIVTTDRLSAFDVILPNPIPLKGKVLTDVSKFWFEKTRHIIPNHWASDVDLRNYLSEDEYQPIKDCALVVRKLKPLPVEAIVRGYLIGSGWKDYQASGKVCGIELPAGLKQAQQLPQPIFTPSTKAAVGDHDENIAFDEVEKLLGTERARQVSDAAIALYQFGADFAKGKGIIVADTKFEFGTDDAGTLYLIDEALTPDSSRFWPADEYATGISPPSFDKQFVRDYLETLDWNKTAPGPELPQEIIQKTAEKYLEAAQRLTS